MAAGILLVVAGVWLVLQANVGDLPGRIVSYKGAGLSGVPGLPDLTDIGGGFNPLDPLGILPDIPLVPGI